MARANNKIEIRSENELGNILYDAMAKAVEYTMVKLFQENQDLIQKYVYDAIPATYYDRTYEFIDAWNYRVKKTSSHHMLPYTSNRVHGEFFYQPVINQGEATEAGVMHYNPAEAQHGTPDWAYPYVNEAWRDAREHLADIIYQGKSGLLFGEGPWRKKRDAWGPLIKSLDRGKIFKWFEEGMAKQKLKGYKR